MKNIPIVMLKCFFALMVAGLVLTACKRETPDTCIRDLELKLQFSLDFYRDTIITTYSGQWADYDMRFIVDVYPDNVSVDPATPASLRLGRWVQTMAAPPRGAHEVTINMPMPERKVNLLIWADFVRKGTQTDLHYNTTNLGQVLVIRPYANGLNPKDAFTAKYELNPPQLPGIPGVLTVPLETPFAKYKIISGDVQKYISEHPTPVQNLTSRVSYHLWIPFGYNVYSGEVNAAAEQIVYTSPMSEIKADSVVVASDYIFVSKSAAGSINGASANYDAQVLLNLVVGNGGTITGVNDIAIPLRRGWMTIVKGDFLTVKTAGIGVDPNFDDEIIIILPDL